MLRGAIRIQDFCNNDGVVIVYLSIFLNRFFSIKPQGSDVRFTVKPRNRQRVCDEPDMRMTRRSFRSADYYFEVSPFGSISWTGSHFIGLRRELTELKKKNEPPRQPKRLPPSLNFGFGIADLGLERKENHHGLRTTPPFSREELF